MFSISIYYQLVNREMYWWIVRCFIRVFLIRCFPDAQPGLTKPPSVHLKKWANFELLFVFAHLFCPETGQNRRLGKFPWSPNTVWADIGNPQPPVYWSYKSTYIAIGQDQQYDKISRFEHYLSCQVLLLWRLIRVLLLILFQITSLL